MIAALILTAALLTADPVRVTGYVWTGQRTASGAWPVAGRTVACPNSVPLGTWVIIEGVGMRRCEDRGCNCFDVFLGSRREAFAITGRRRVAVMAW